MSDTLQFDEKAIRGLFKQYVGSFEDGERHTKQAVMEAETFDSFLTGAIPSNMKLQIAMYEKAMNVAVEFEEDGFVAGFKYAMNLLLSQEQEFIADTQIPTTEAETRRHEAVNAPKAVSKMTDCFITSLQIAELFQTPNFKIVKRIEERIMPLLDDSSKALFEKTSGMNSQNKPVIYYKLNQAACMMYLEAMEPNKTKFLNIAGGYAKLQELMQKVFPTEKVPLPA